MQVPAGPEHIHVGEGGFKASGSHLQQGSVRFRVTARRLALSTGIVLVVIGCMLYGTRSIRLTRHVVDVAGLPEDLDGLVVLHLSDLHSKEFGPGQARLARLLGGLEYDIVALTGDFVDANKQDKKPALELLSVLRGPVFYVFGNHDLHPGCDATSDFRARGIEVLRDRAVPLAVRGRRIWVVGVDSTYSTARGFDKAIRRVPAGETTLLLTHSPGVFPQAAAAGVDVLFCGHTHGGQVRLPFVGALYVPGQGLLPKYSWGLYRSGSTTMIVSAGLGESALPLRFLCRPEVGLITLRAAVGQSSPVLTGTSTHPVE